MTTPDETTRLGEAEIIDAIRRNITYLDDLHARGLADTILRNLHAAGLEIQQISSNTAK